MVGCGRQLGGATASNRDQINFENEALRVGFPIMEDGEPGSGKYSALQRRCIKAHDEEEPGRKQ
ncbi:hypothetical protein [Streptomyces lydicus]|uniref:hypothetical protein n=1 Tax=Streptomyces lydicus TaxID=47763 RepID=UPI00101355D7|nr:hypothetical protein [Streptomyces lydicus]MCZ1009596.1 hypothetical protein [Streptomyces lydicus]